MFNTLWRRAASVTVLIWVSGLLVVAMVAGTLVPGWAWHRQPWFIGLLGVLGANVLACVTYRWKAVRWPSLISHAGLLTILAGGMITGIWGEHGTIKLVEGENGDCCVQGQQGAVTTHLPFTVKLKKFSIERYGEPAHELLIRHRTEGWTKSLTLPSGDVNVRHAVEGTPYTVTVKRWVADFSMDLATRTVVERSAEPRNPALLVELRASPPREVWVFAKYPAMHQESLPVELEYRYQEPQIKQYKSHLAVATKEGAPLHDEVVWVNRPMRYQGYTFYQSGYDPEDLRVSELQVAKDPGVPVVYGGFGILLAGLTLNVLRRREP